MKEFSSILSVYPVAEMSPTEESPWLTSPQTAHKFAADLFRFDPLASETDSGTSFDCSQTFIIDTPSDSEIQRFSCPVRSIMVISDTDGHQYPIGSRRIPGTVMIQKGIQRSRLVFKCLSTVNPI